mmetsp:Transcript_8462/g.12781  ORF Transcript_8462/g.12781 Transcript_8462/m.12781 type:complete len:163 (-) Transcript_8462:43-531(-)
MWDLTASKSISIVEKGAGHPIQSVSMASDASIIAAGNNHGRIFIFEHRQDERKFKLLKEFVAHEAYLLKCILSKNNRSLVTTSSDQTAKIWKVGDDYKLDKVLAQHQRWVWDAAFSDDSNYLVTASSDQSAKLWELSNGNVIRNYVGHSNAVTCVALNDSST